MIYTFKRYFSHHLKALQIFFRMKRDKREIAKAYREKKEIPGVTVTRPMLVKTGIVVGAAALLVVGILASGSIVRTVQSFTASLQNRQRTAAAKRAKQKAATNVEKVEKKSPATKPQKKKEAPPPAVPKEPAPLSNLHKHALPLGQELRYCIVANKKTRLMYILRHETPEWSLFRTYPMAIGEEKGKKTRAGDKKTPEGLYFIIGRKERSELTSEYGPLAFVLNYPNARDRELGYTGNGIWIHGTKPDSMPVQTKGCLELNNEHIMEVGRYLKVGIGTPVLIVNKQTISDPIKVPDFKKIRNERKKILAEYRHRSNYFISLIDQWEKAWESKNMDRYSYYYNQESFSGQGLEWEAWRERKQRTFEMYSFIDVSFDNIFLSEFTETTAVIKFLQNYKSDRLNVVNGKKLSFSKSNGTWKIYREQSLPKEELLL